MKNFGVDFMKSKIFRYLLITVIVIAIVFTGVYVYSSRKSTNEVPKRAKFVNNFANYCLMG